jgi:hypothetical protein
MGAVLLCLADMLIDDFLSGRIDRYQLGVGASAGGIGSTNWSTFFCISDAVYRNAGSIRVSKPRCDRTDLHKHVDL